MDRSTEDSLFQYEIDFKVGKKQLSKIIEKCIKVHGAARTSEVLDAIKAQGYKYSTKGALTVAVCDAAIPPEKKDLIAEAEAQVDSITRLFNKGLMSDDERYRGVIKTWNETTNKVTDALNKNMDPYNPIFMMSDSGARGSINQIRQLAGMRGLIANTSGRTIEVPIRANYREGLNILEYFISSRGARKGLADTALRTADSGYLTRRLVDVAQDVIIRQHDCGTHNGIEVYDIKDGKEMIEPLTERLVGRYPGRGLLRSPDRRGHRPPRQDAQRRRRRYHRQPLRRAADQDPLRAHLRVQAGRLRLAATAPTWPRWIPSPSARRWASSPPSPSANPAPS